MTQRRRILTVVLLIVILLSVVLGIGLYRADKLTVTNYTVKCAAFSQPLTVVHLSDLHCCKYGIDNEMLVRDISAAEPNLIFMTGDIINRESEDADLIAVLDLTKELSGIAPVFYSLGNHEVEYMQKHGRDFLLELKVAGATVLDQQYVEIAIDNQKLRIGGIYGYLLSTTLESGEEQLFMQDFTDTQLPTLLLCHMSEGLLDYGSINDWKADVVFSGHAHGGQIRLPLIGGLYDPETGWFPKYEKGAYQIADSTVIVSAGLGSSERLPRFNNPPEIVVVSIEPMTYHT